MDADFILALQLQEQFDIEHESGSQWPSDSPQSNNNVSNNNYTNNKPTTVEPGGEGRGGGGHGSRDPERPLSVVDPSWEMLDPSPDVRAMFLTFNDRFFWGKLSGVEVKWSPRMTLCAGVCSYEGRGGLCSIRLSAPLLKLRPRRDLVETLLHEMIHALLFVTQNNRDRDGHGPEFCKHMNRINTDTGTKISIYHSFNDEVDAYRTHWWRCNGPCQTRKPYLGYVKRAMNRAPSALDNWWGDHQRSCGGTYIKVKEPEGYKKKGKAVAGSKDEKTPEMRAPGNGKSSKPTKTPEMQAPGNSKSSKPTTGSGLQDIRSFIPFSGQGVLLGGGTSSPAFSPKKPLFSPSSQTNASPSLQGRLGNPVTKVQGPPKKRSVGNTRYFTNVNGSPVKRPNPLPRTTGTGIPSGIGGRGGDPRTTTGSIADIFNRRPPLRTSSPSATVSKPPDETTGGAAVPSSNRTSSTGLSAAIAATHKPSFNTVKKEESNPFVFPTASKPSSAKPTKPGFFTVKKEESKHTSVFPASSKTSSAKPTKPGFFTVKKEESKHTSVFPASSKPSSAKPNHSNHSERANRDSIAGSGASRKRPLDDSADLMMSFLREALGSEESPTPPEVKRSRVVSPPSAHASSAVVAGMPSSSSSHQATTSSISTNSSSFPSSNPSVLSTSGLRTGAASSSFPSSNPTVLSTSGLRTGAASSSFPSSNPSVLSTSGLRTGAASSSSASHPFFDSTSGLPTGAASSASQGVSCPICQVKVQESKINAHLDSCLSWQHLN